MRRQGDSLKELQQPQGICQEVHHTGLSKQGQTRKSWPGQITERIKQSGGKRRAQEDSKQRKSAGSSSFNKEGANPIVGQGC
jgi:hypothetical protein